MGRILLQVWLSTTFLFFAIEETREAVMPPPWANPKLNPCASQPQGWQLLFWPPDGKCYKIFQVGPPCPDDMELTARVGNPQSALLAECRCPPTTAQSAKDGRCYALFTSGPCEPGSYFGLDTEYKPNGGTKRQWGVCKQLNTCSDPKSLSWPKDGKCYRKYTRGPCPKGQLLIQDPITKLSVCKCNKEKDLREYLYEDGHCYQHFTKGPCLEKGHLFLPDSTCGCHTFLPHFHRETKKCFELGTIGPCARGETFQMDESTAQGQCQCKPGYIRYTTESKPGCYRPYTQAACEAGHILVNSTTCIPQPCPKGYLYFSRENKCYRVGSRGPCENGRLVTFDFETRPSIDGVSYNGVCACANRDCSVEKCDRTKGMIKFANKCHRLYSQGPCPKGAWLVPKRQGREELFSGGKELEGTCECIPGHIRKVRTVRQMRFSECMSPASLLAEYLNKNYTIEQIVSA